MVYLHPVFGGVGVVAVVALAFVGLRSRHKAPYAAASRRWHRVAGRWVWLAVAVSALAGTATVAVSRPKLSVGASAHFWVMWTMVAVMSAAGLLAWWFDAWPRGQVVHPALGLVASMLALLGLFLGIGLLP